MKQIFLLLTALSLASLAHAQAPQKFSSQIVVRDASGELVTESPVQIRISINQGEPDGFGELQEVHSLTTNVNGLASFEIGTGTWVFGFIESIDWSNGPYFIQTEVDPTNSSNYTISSTTELLSVPYALYAANTTFTTANGRTSNQHGDYAEDDFVFGSPQLQYDGNSDHYARMFFDKGKGAFRAGSITFDGWDDQDVGLGSIAMGVEVSASGDYSTALGWGTSASGDYSTAMGSNSVASGDYSSAKGYSTTAQSYAETVIGKHNSFYSPQSITQWNDLDRLFVIGNGFSSTFPSDAMVVLKNGNTGLSTSTPNEVLEVAGDGRAFFGDGAGDDRKGLLIDGIQGANGARIEAFNYGTGNGMNLLLNSSNTSGFVGIRTNSPNVSLDVSGSIEYTGTITDVSDERLKENFESIDNALESITQLQGYSYNMKDDEEMTREYGVIAQEVQKVFPEMVTVVDEEEGYLGVSYVQLIPVLLEAIKEQDSRLDAQEDLIEEMSLLLRTLSANNSKD